MIIAILDYHIRGVDVVVDTIDYKEHMKDVIHFEEHFFPCTDISLTHFYVGY